MINSFIYKNYKKLVFIIIILFTLILVSSFFFISLPGKSPTYPYRYKDCNLIMISLANVSAEHMSLYGYKRLTTPNLDQWAEDAIVFENAFTQTSWTLPAATSLFTSLYPYSHQVIDRYSNNVLDGNIETLPEILRDRGYKTAAFTGGLDYSSKFGHMRGFEDVDEAADFSFAISFAGFGLTLEKALNWLNKNSEKKFFLFLHGYDTHCPFDPPEYLKGTFSSTEGKKITVNSNLCLRGFEDSEDDNYKAYYYKTHSGVQEVNLTKDDIVYLEDLYDEEILAVDKLVENFLDSLDKTIVDKTVIVIFSDHGEMFAKHGRFGRAGSIRGTLYDDVVHIPLIIKVPKQKGKTVNGSVQIIDVMPTLLDILDLSTPKQVQGKNLTSLIKGGKENINEYIFAGSKFGMHEGYRAWQVYPVHSINESVRTKKWKLIHEIKFSEEAIIEEETYELYDLKNDPDELYNLTEEQLLVVKKLKKVLEDWKMETESSDVQNVSSPKLLPPEIIEGAKEAGYW